MTIESAPPSVKDRQFKECDLVEEIVFLMARTQSLGSTRANHALKPLGLKVRSYSVLSLACSSLAPSQRELADYLSLDPSQIVPLVDSLQHEGLVERVPDPSDRRSKVVKATTKGRRLYTRARAATRQSEADTLEALSSEEREQLRSLLSRVAL